MRIDGTENVPGSGGDPAVTYFRKILPDRQTGIFGGWQGRNCKIVYPFSGGVGHPGGAFLQRFSSNVYWENFDG
jgi:hypothetical protein